MDANRPHFERCGLFLYVWELMTSRVAVLMVGLLSFEMEKAFADCLLREQEKNIEQ